MRNIFASLLLIIQCPIAWPSEKADLDVPLRFEGVTPENIPICYDYACSAKDEISLSAHEWGLVQSAFQPAATTADEERAQLRQALKQLEIIAGEYTPINRDTGGYSQGLWPGQMDCIDEATNTTTFLLLLKRTGLIRFHKINTYAYRAPFIFDQHYSGQITDINTGQHYAVDSWFLDYGNPPYIQLLEEWKSRKDPVTSIQ